MDQFIACICDNDLMQLVASGKPSAEEISEAWASLFYAYCDEIEATETLYRTRLIAEISIEKQRNTLVTDWLKILRVVHMPGIANAIKIIGYADFELNPADDDGYQADLNRIQAEVNTSKLQVRIKEAEYEAILENQSTQGNVDAKYFATIFFRINNYAKREAVNGQTTVQNYCAALRDFVAHIEQSNKH